MSSNSSLVVLGDAVIHDLLINLSLPEILRFHDKLASCLVELTLGEERAYQPEAGIVNRPEGQKILFRSFTSSDGMGTKIIATPKPIPTADGLKTPPLCGVVTLCDAGGRVSGILNGKEITGYRTTMSAMMPFLWRRDVSNIVVFGAGVQALWHSRLALALRGSEIKSITLVNRSLPRAKEVVAQVEKENASLWKSQASLKCLDPSGDDYDKQLLSLVQNASVIFCTTPATIPLFPASYIIDRLESNGNTTGPLITGVGSWQPTMLEIHPDLIRYAIQRSNDIDFSSENPKGSQTTRGGAIVTDDRLTSMKHAGEIVQSGLVAEEIVELGDLIDRWEKGTLSDRVKDWMLSGFLIYKSIGISMTDLITGQMILDLAREKNLGTMIGDF